MTTRTMTGVVLTAVTLLASPAFAQSHVTTQRDAYRAYAQSRVAPPRVAPRVYRHAPPPSVDAYDTYGRYVGSDPDPNVRQMIQRDRAEQDGGGY